jgi:hypothetical protein
MEHILWRQEVKTGPYQLTLYLLSKRQEIKETQRRKSNANTFQKISM